LVGSVVRQLAMVMIMVGLYVFQIRREERQQDRYERKDAAYIEALAAIQNNIVRLEQDSNKNWEITRNISTVVADSAKALAAFRCLHKKQPN
jgi:preprotein translocase subunit YajC